ncbi:MAG: lyase family protein [Candidatus Woesearchaeota archaeon]
MELANIQPKPSFSKENSVDPWELTAQRYGTPEMVQIWGAERTFEYSLRVQGLSAEILSQFYPELVPPEHAREISGRATLQFVNKDRIREIEAAKGHDVFGICGALEEALTIPEARAQVNLAKTSADTTQPARVMQLKQAFEVIAESVENLRDILIEKSVSWRDVPHMDTTHLYDALPTVAGRPLSHYVEMLQSGLDRLAYTYHNSLMGKWSDATGNYHSATVLGLDGVALERELCDRLGVKSMIAAAQLPGLEYELDVFFSLARLGETMNNLARYIAWGRGDDVNIFVNASPTRKKGSSAMPHKDSKNGNPTAEEQTMSLRNYLAGTLVTAMLNCQITYARDLSASANSRINLEGAFKFSDHVIRSLANQVYWIKLKEERCKERVDRSYGVVCSQAVMSYLTDARHTSNPMARSQAHDLMGRLATQAWESRTPFIEVVITEAEVTSRLDVATLRSITDPYQYIGKSKNIIDRVANAFYQKKTLAL